MPTLSSKCFVAMEPGKMMMVGTKSIAETRKQYLGD